MRGRSLVPTPSQSPYHTFQSITILGRGETPPRRGGIKQGGNSGHAGDLLQLGQLETMGPKHAKGMYGRSSSKWFPMVRLEQTTTPRTRREPARVAPDRIGSPKGSKPSLFR